MIFNSATTATVIRAQDFSDKVSDPNRGTWTPAKLRHVIAALGDTPVIITTDNQTGFSLVGVTLVGLRAGHSHSYEVGIRSVFDDGTQSTVWHLIFMLGDTIVPLGGDNVKWTAKRTWADEKSFAAELAQSQHGDCEGRSWGKWEAAPGLHEVHVSYTPSTGNPSFADEWGERGSWTYGLPAVARQGRVRQNRMHELYPNSYQAIAVDEEPEADPIDLQDVARGDFTPGSDG